MTTGPRHWGGIVLRGLVLLGLLGSSSMLAGCGGSHEATPAPSPPPAKRAVTESKAPQLISMRRVDGATYQTVVIRTDGTGYVAVFIGERAHITHDVFRVSPRELVQLRQLTRVASATPEGVYFGTPPPSVVYILFDHGHVLQLAKGHVPRRIAGLTTILSGLIDRYA